MVQVCGAVNKVLMSSDTDGGDVRHAFVEFAEKTGAQAALVLNGQMLGSRLIKVGLAKNVLVKPQKTTADQKKMEEAMRKVRAAQARLSNIGDKADDKKSDDSSRGRMRSDGARSRSRPRSSRRSSSRGRRWDAASAHCEREVAHIAGRKAAGVGAAEAGQGVGCRIHIAL